MTPGMSSQNQMLGAGHAFAPPLSSGSNIHQGQQHDNSMNRMLFSGTAVAETGFNRKTARQSMERVIKSMKSRQGDDTAFVGVSTGESNKLSSHNDAVAFVDELSRKMQVEDGGIWAFPVDQYCTDGYTRDP